VYSTFLRRPDRRLAGRVTVAMANACIDANQLTEAKQVLDPMPQLDAGPQRHTWAWFDPGRVCRSLGEPAEHSQQAFDKARELAPKDDKLLDLLERQNKPS
jgi:thioredoxin-like negative regulator of GroEL